MGCWEIAAGGPWPELCQLQRRLSAGAQRTLWRWAIHNVRYVCKHRIQDIMKFGYVYCSVKSLTDLIWWLFVCHLLILPHNESLQQATWWGTWSCTLGGSGFLRWAASGSHIHRSAAFQTFRCLAEDFQCRDPWVSPAVPLAILQSCLERPLDELVAEVVFELLGWLHDELLGSDGKWFDKNSGIERCHCQEIQPFFLMVSYWMSGATWWTHYWQLIPKTSSFAVAFCVAGGGWPLKSHRSWATDGRRFPGSSWPPLAGQIHWPCWQWNFGPVWPFRTAMVQLDATGACYIGPAWRSYTTCRNTVLAQFVVLSCRVTVM